jgi:hypothetical protein
VRAFHDAVLAQIGAVLQHHIQVGGEAARGDHHPLGVKVLYLTRLDIFRPDTEHPIPIHNKLAGGGGGQPLVNAPLLSGLVQGPPEAAAAALGMVPAGHRVALLLVQSIPLDSPVLPPLEQLPVAVLDIESDPNLVRRPLAEANPIVEGQIGRILDPLGPLQLGPHQAATAAGDGRRAAQRSLLLQHYHFGSRFSGLDAGRHPRAPRANDYYIGLLRLLTGHEFTSQIF